MSLVHPLLAACGVAHGFGLRDTPEPRGLLRPRQVHGHVVVSAEACRAAPAPEADAVVSTTPGQPVGIVTADCVPILLATTDGQAVAAVHAGWRGLAGGVVEAGVDALRRSAGAAVIVAAIGPHVGACCYEVDAPVIEALGTRYPDALPGALRPARAGHGWLDLGALVAAALVGAGLDAGLVGALSGCCTACDATRFHSYRRDGERAGRLVHHAAAGRLDSAKPSS